MPVYHAVQCCSCNTFQVQQVKKVNKFSCAVCGVKQSVRKAYAASSKAKDVRVKVQQLNGQRGVKEQSERAQPPVEFDEAPDDVDLRVAEHAAGPLAWAAYTQTEPQVMKSFPDCGGETMMTALPEDRKIKRRKLLHTQAIEAGLIPSLQRQPQRGRNMTHWEHCSSKDHKKADTPNMGREEALASEKAECLNEGSAWSSASMPTNKFEESSAGNCNFRAEHSQHNPGRYSLAAEEQPKKAAAGKKPSKWSTYESTARPVDVQKSKTVFSVRWSEAGGDKVAADMELVTVFDAVNGSA